MFISFLLNKIIKYFNFSRHFVGSYLQTIFWKESGTGNLRKAVSANSYFNKERKILLILKC